ncbi:MAG: hypothetical protein QM811_08550 [Pirellulales bacterium]
MTFNEKTERAGFVLEDAVFALLRYLWVVLLAMIGLIALLVVLLFSAAWLYGPSDAVNDLVRGKTPIRAIELTDAGSRTFHIRVDDAASMADLQAALAVAQTDARSAATRRICVMSDYLMVGSPSIPRRPIFTARRRRSRSTSTTAKIRPSTCERGPHC